MHDLRENPLVKDTKQFIEELMNRWEKKQKEYHSFLNPYYSFEQATEISFHDIREKVLWEYLTKHLQSLKEMVRACEFPMGDITDEKIDEKIGDIVLYLFILRGMLIDHIKLDNNEQKDN